MRNIVLVTDLDRDRKYFINVEDISVISVPMYGTCILNLRNGNIFNIPASEYEYVMCNWAPKYTELSKYKDYINNKKE